MMVTGLMMRTRTLFFMVVNTWFEEAFEEGMKGHEIMSRGYLDAKKRDKTVKEQ